MWRLHERTVKTEDIRAEFDRRKSQTARLLAQFKKQGELNTADLQRIGTGCSSRIHELRKEGHIIVPTYEKPGMWRYVYLGQKDDVHDTL
jgi:hypothetical protein